tara:strand:- start:107 stop:496 length:390 start_codon:yes stop_codon:yes gene_type:complete
MVKGYDYRPEISGNDMNIDKVNTYNQAQMDLFKNQVFLENRDKVKLDNNEFMNLTIQDIYNNIMNLIPNLYNDYHKKYLEVSLKNTDKFISDNIIVKETIMSMIFNNKNIVYLGIVIIFISFFLYMINL